MFEVKCRGRNVGIGDVDATAEEEFPGEKELARVFLSVVIIGCLIEFGGKSGCRRGGGRLECEIGGSEKVGK